MDIIAMYRFPEGRRLNRLLAGWEGSAAIFTARLMVLELWRSMMGGGGQPMIRSAARTTLCSLAFARADAEANQTMREDVSTLSMTAL